MSIVHMDEGPEMSESDLVLFERWRHDRDAEAFAELVSRYADMVYATCRRVTGDAVAAEDVTQECFLKLAEGRAQVHRSVAGWLHSLATCRSLDRLRGEARRRRLEERFAGEALEPVTVAWEDLQPHIDAAIEDLPERLREVVVRHFLHGETHAEVAARLGVSRPAVSKSIARGVERIRAFLRRRGIAVSAVVLTGLVADGAVEAAPESVRVSLGKLALSGVPEGVPLVAAAATASMLTLVTMAGAIALVVATYVALFAWHAPVSAPPASAAGLPASGGPSALTPPSPTPVTVSLHAAAASRTDSATTLEGEQLATATVRGIIRSYDGSPLAGAKVEISEIERFPGFKRDVFAAITKEDGTYEISGIRTKGTTTVAVRVSAPGHSDKVEGIELVPGVVQDHMDLDLRPGTTLVGQVLSSGGFPVPNAMVMPWSIHCNWEMERLIDEGGDFVISCDDNGRFELGYFLDDSTESSVDSLDIVAPGYGAASFSNVQFSAGEVVPFRLQEPCVIQGRVQWKDGSPAVGYVAETQSMHLSDDRSMFYGARRGSVIDKDGSYKIDWLPPEVPYGIWVRRIDGPMVPNTRTQTPPIAPGGVFEYNPVLSQPTRITGNVHIQGCVKPIGRFSARAIKEGMKYATVIDYNEDGGDFELLFGEPGTYWVYPEYEPVEFGYTDSLKAYGTRVELKTGDDIRVDLGVPKPYVFPVRVIDTEGQPIPNVELRICWNVTPDDKSNLTTTERKLDADGRFTWFCFPSPEVWFTAAAKGYHTEATVHRIAESNVTAPEETLVLYPAAGLKANLVFSDNVEKHGGVQLRVTYSDGTAESMDRTSYFCGNRQMTVTSGYRADRVALVAVEVDVERPHRSEVVECTLAPNEITDIGDLVLR